MGRNTRATDKKILELNKFSLDMLTNWEFKVEHLLLTTERIVNGKHSSFMIVNTEQNRVKVHTATGRRAKKLIMHGWLDLEKESITYKTIHSGKEYLISEINCADPNPAHKCARALSSNIGNAVVHTTGKNFGEQDGHVINLVAWSLSDMAREIETGTANLEIAFVKGQLRLLAKVFDRLNGKSKDNPYTTLADLINETERKGDYNLRDQSVFGIRTRLNGRKDLSPSSSMDRIFLRIGEELRNKIEGTKTYKYDSAEYNEIKHALAYLAREKHATIVSEQTEYMDVAKLRYGQNGLDHYESFCQAFPNAESLVRHNEKTRNLIVLSTPDIYGVVIDGNHTLHRAKELGINCLYAKTICYSRDDMADPYLLAGENVGKNQLNRFTW